MKKSYLKVEANVLRAQKHQLNGAKNKLSEIDSILSRIQQEQNDSSSQLDKMIEDMEKLLDNNDFKIDSKDIDKNMKILESKLNSDISNQDLKLISKIDLIKIDENIDWNDYVNLVENYALEHNLDLQEDPFKHLMTKSQRVELQKQIEEDFTFKNAYCDKYDYMIAGTCGVIGGLIDILFVGIPGDSKLGNIADEQANKITEKFAEFIGWDKNKAVENGKNTTASAIGYLERKFKVNYDQSTTYATSNQVNNLYLKNHHLKSLGHSPDLIGLFSLC